MDADQREQLAQTQKDANRLLLLLEGSQAKLRQAKEEVWHLQQEYDDHLFAQRLADEDAATALAKAQEDVNELRGAVAKDEADLGAFERIHAQDQEELTQVKLDLQEAKLNQKHIVGHLKESTDQLAQAKEEAERLLNKVPPHWLTAKHNETYWALVNEIHEQKEQLTQAQEEVERLEKQHKADWDWIPTFKALIEENMNLSEIIKALSPSEAKDARD